jgi:hypothetical protein
MYVQGGGNLVGFLRQNCKLGLLLVTHRRRAKDRDNWLSFRLFIALHPCSLDLV